MVAVWEDHAIAGQEPTNRLASISLGGGNPEILAEGHDFFAAPRFSPDGKQFAWLAWDHPNMPWDVCELWLAEVSSEGALQNPRKIAGGVGESVNQPEWSPTGVLHFASDKTGWWNLYRWEHGIAKALCPREAEFALPLWVFGSSTYAFLNDGSIFCGYCEEGLWKQGILHRNLTPRGILHGNLTPLGLPYNEIDNVRGGKRATFLGTTPTSATQVIAWDPNTKKAETIFDAVPLPFDPSYVSKPEVIHFPTEKGKSAYAFYYPPVNPDFQGPPGGKPLCSLRATEGRQPPRPRRWISRFNIGPRAVLVFSMSTTGGAQATAASTGTA